MKTRRLGSWQSASRLLIAVGLTTMLAACGGGSSGDSTDTTDGGLDSTDGTLDPDPVDMMPVVGAPNNGADGGVLSCGADNGGTDATSETASWTDNCVVSRGNPFSTSYYTRGIQRILFCNGFNNGVASFGTFADAQFGPGTEAALRAFQSTRDPALDQDAVVGPMTWGALFDTLREVQSPEIGMRAYASGDQCGDDIQFYQQLVDAVDIDGNPILDGDGNQMQVGAGWMIANSPPNDVSPFEFSVRNPFN